MKRRASPWTAVVALLAACYLPARASAGGPPSPNPAAPSVTEAPALHFGDQWRYNDGVVSRVWGDSEGRLQMQLGRGIPPMDFPLFVGKRWTTTHYYGSVVQGNPRRIDIVDISFEYTLEVVAFEPVSTPAGTFDAYVIRWIRPDTGPDRPGIAMMVWYSPAVRAVVKRMTLTPTGPRRDLELQAYRLTP